MDISLTDLDDVSLTRFLSGGSPSSGLNTGVPDNIEYSQKHDFSKLLPESLATFSSDPFTSNSISVLVPTGVPTTPKPPHESFSPKPASPSHSSASLSSHTLTSPAPPGEIEPIYLRTAGGTVNLVAPDGYLLRTAMGKASPLPVRHDLTHVIWI